MNNEPFNTDGIKNIDEISGYSKCLTSLMAEILNNNIFDPEKRLVDPVILLEKISKTATELALKAQGQSNLFSKN